MSRYYIRQNISRLLREGFTHEALLLFCYDQPEIKNVYLQLRRKPDNQQLISLILEWAERSIQYEALLAWAKTQNLDVYDTHQPYWDSEPVDEAYDIKSPSLDDRNEDNDGIDAPPVANLSNTQKMFLTDRLTELQAPLQTYNRRIQALEGDLARELDSERQIILQERLMEIKNQRNDIQREVEVIEQQLG